MITKLFSFIILSIGLICASPIFCLASTFSPYVAHAGGAFNGLVYTNCLEALNSNYEKGFRYFEVDISWTSDNSLVLIHDWNETFREYFFFPGTNIPSKQDFTKLISKKNITALTLENLIEWSNKKGDVFIITDVKSENIRALSKIKEMHSDFCDMMIPQVYSYHEYEKAIDLGYKNVILTLYKMKINPNEVLSFSKNKVPWAITMPWETVFSGLAFHLAKNNIKVYAHTINEKVAFEELKKLGVFGIYTDFILPE